MIVRLGLTWPVPAGPPGPPEYGGGGGGGLYDGGGGTVGSLIEASPFREEYSGSCTGQSTQRYRGPPEPRAERPGALHGPPEPVAQPLRIPRSPARPPAGGSAASPRPPARKEPAARSGPWTP